MPRGKFNHRASFYSKLLVPLLSCPYPQHLANSTLSTSHKMMETGYSSLFALGLSSIQTSFPRSVSPQPPTVPTPVTPSRSHSSMTTTSSTFNLQAPPRIHINTQLSPSRPRLRKRRSSLTVANSPMAGIKSPSRTAGMSFNRAILLSPSKSRTSESVAQQSFMQRLRSGSLGSALRFVDVFDMLLKYFN